MVAFACRYGHQPRDQVGLMTMSQLGSLNAALGKLIDKENDSGGSRLNNMATGGG
jgi:hypothetical protein